MGHHYPPSDKSSNVFGVAVVAAAIGAVVGLLMAPKSGEETRAELRTKLDDMKQKSNEAATTARDKVTQKADAARDKVHQMTDKTREKVNDVADKADDAADKQAETAKARADEAVARNRRRTNTDV